MENKSIIVGKIENIAQDGKLTITAHYDDWDTLVTRKFKECRIALLDSRKISEEQRKKAYAIMQEIADFMGEMPEYVKRLFKLKFIKEQMDGLAEDIFSLGDCDVTLARAYITYLIDFVIAHEIPSKIPLSELCDDIQKYIYTTLLFKKCAVCGNKGELHHVDTVGMGRDRKEIAHEGMNAICLCNKHHTECHKTGDKSFMDKYHLESVKLDKKLCKKYKLKDKQIYEQSNNDRESH